MNALALESFEKQLEQDKFINLKPVLGFVTYSRFWHPDGNTEILKAQGLYISY